MVESRFRDIQNCFRFSEEEIDALGAILIDNGQVRWVLDTSVVVDESMVPCKCHNNPHHIFITRKPNPNGIKVCFIFLISYIYKV